MAGVRMLRVLDMNTHASHILLLSGLSKDIHMMNPSSTIIYTPIQISEPSQGFLVSVLVLEA